MSHRTDDAGVALDTLDRIEEKIERLVKLLEELVEALKTNTPEKGLG